MLDISNGTREFSKRLYFNKPQLQIGFIDIKPTDRLSLKFSVVKNGASEESTKELIQEYVYEVNGEVLTGVSESCRGGDPIPLRTWVPQVIGFSLYYTGSSGG